MKTVKSKRSHEYEPSPDVLSQVEMISSRREDMRLEIKVLSCAAALNKMKI